MEYFVDCYRAQHLLLDKEGKYACIFICVSSGGSGYSYAEVFV